MRLDEVSEELAQTIERLVDEACAAAYLEYHDGATPFSNEAINWGDMGCADVVFLTRDGEEFDIDVTLEEADPSSAELCGYVARHLKDKGYEVSVSCQW